jgi:hypothetical protein
MASRRPAATLDSMPVEVFLDGFSPAHRAIAERLRSIVLGAVPDATERVRVGWRLIGFDLPIDRRSVFFAWVFPEAEHVHLGFPAGVLIDDPRGVMSGAGITKRARWLTWKTGDAIDADLATELVLAAEAVARLPRGALA